MKNLVKMTRAEYTAAKAARTLVCPNTCLISDETQSVEFLYANPMVDVGITGLDGGVRKFYSYEEYDALEVKPTDPMTYLATATEILGILPNVNTSVKWSSEYKTVPGCLLTAIRYRHSSTSVERPTPMLFWPMSSLGSSPTALRSLGRRSRSRATER